MAAWSALVWHRAIDMLEHGTDTCMIPKSPLFINCNKSDLGDTALRQTKPSKRLKNPGTVTLQQSVHKTVNLSEVTIKQSKRGSFMSFTKSQISKIYKAVKRIAKSCLSCLKPHPRVIASENSADQETSTTSVEYSSSVPYARVGW